jgi:hypothetical protein
MSTPFLTQLISLLTLLIALSVATERLVAIVQNLSTKLRTTGTTAKKEGHRKALVQFIAVVAGIITACLSQEILPDIPLLHIKGAETHWPVLGLLGLLASGGSGFWTDILGYVKGVKDTQQAAASSAQVQTALTNVAIADAPANALARIALNDSAPLTARALAAALPTPDPNDTTPLDNNLRTDAREKLAAAIRFANQR